MKWFTNISVGKKLTMGFSIVLLLCLLLGIIGWTAITTLSSRMDVMSNVNLLLQSVSSLELTRSEYLRSAGDAAKDAQMHERLKGVEANYRVLDKSMTKPVNREILGRFNQQLSQYISDVKALEESYAQSGNRQSGGGARALLGKNSDAAVVVFDRLQKELAADVTSDADTRFQRSQLLAQVQAQFQRARFETRGYTYSGDTSHFQRAVEQVEASLASLPPLQAAFGASASELEGYLKGYRAALDTNQAALLKIDQAATVLANSGRDLIKISNELYDMQMKLRASDAAQAYWQLAGCLAAALCLGALAGWTINRQIVPALRLVVRDVEQLGNGDLSSRHYETRHDEIGQLQQSLYRTTTGLRELIEHIGEGARQVAHSSEELSSITDVSLKGAEDQQHEVQQVATAMHEMATSVQDVARNAVATSNAAEAAVKHAEQGTVVVSQSLQHIERLSTEMDHTTLAVNTLEEESSKIGNVLDVIKSVAEQTNLLALNAAIEAARAGESGRGFAVVADEVRSLAQRTQQSTQEIQSLVQALQTGTLNVVERMKTSRALTSTSVNLARDTGTALNEICAGISSVQAMTQQIAAAAEQQGAVAEEINRSVLNVREIAEQTASSSQQTNRSSVDLARLGEELQTQLRRFST